MSKTFKESKSDFIVNFIEKHEDKWQEDYGQDVRRVAVDIIMDIEMGVHVIDFFNVNDFLDWFDEVVRDDYDAIDKMSFDEFTNLRDIVSDYFNEHILNEVVELDEEYELIDDFMGLYDF